MDVILAALALHGLPVDHAAAFALPLAVVGGSPGADDRGVRQVVQRVVGNGVVPALPDEDPRAVPVKQPQMVEVVAADGVVAVEIVAAEPVAAQHDAAAAEVGELAVGDRVAHGCQVEAHPPGAGLDKAAVGHRTVVHMAEAQHAGGGVVHLPVMLNPLARETMKSEAPAVGELDPGEMHLPDRAQAGLGVIAPLDADEFGEQGRLQARLRFVAFGTVIESRACPMEHPRAKLEHTQTVFQPDGAMGGTVRNPDGIGAGLRKVDDVALEIHPLDRQDVHGPLVDRDDQALGLLQVGCIGNGACREGEGLAAHRLRAG